MPGPSIAYALSLDRQGGPNKPSQIGIAYVAWLNGRVNRIWLGGHGLWFSFTKILRPDGHHYMLYKKLI